MHMLQVQIEECSEQKNIAHQVANCNNEDQASDTNVFAYGDERYERRFGRL